MYIVLCADRRPQTVGRYINTNNNTIRTPFHYTTILPLTWELLGRAATAFKRFHIPELASGQGGQEERYAPV